MVSCARDACLYLPWTMLEPVYFDVRKARNLPCGSKWQKDSQVLAIRNGTALEKRKRGTRNRFRCSAKGNVDLPSRLRNVVLPNYLDSRRSSYTVSCSQCCHTSAINVGFSERGFRLNTLRRSCRTVDGVFVSSLLNSSGRMTTFIEMT